MYVEENSARMVFLIAYGFIVEELDYIFGCPFSVIGLSASMIFNAIIMVEK